MYSTTESKWCGECIEGFVRQAGTGHMMPCECRTRRRPDVQFKAALSPRYHDARIENFSSGIVAAATSWTAKPTDGLMLMGPAGTGKTHLAAAISRRLIENGRHVIFKRCPDLFLELRDTIDKRDVTEGAILARHVDAAFLVLDDLGSGSLSDHERRVTLDLLDRRMNHLRPTVITTNLRFEELAARIDERVASRVNTFTRIVLTGGDRRARGSSRG